ncbi:hypothetical protein P4J60_26550 [Bacillus cereus]|nr:hypothetical protein [Bacillus cereus]MEB9570780.1 hypothetical protein [Bacillus cereus]
MSNSLKTKTTMITIAGMLMTSLTSSFTKGKKIKLVNKSKKVKVTKENMKIKGKLGADCKQQIDIEDVYLAEKESKVTTTKVQDSGITLVIHEVTDQDEKVTGTVGADVIFKIKGREKEAKESGKVIQIVEMPTIHDYYTTDAFAKGIAPKASNVALYIEGEFIRSAVLSADGAYTIYTGDQKGLQKEEQTFQIAARDSDGNESEKVTNVVKIASALTAQEYRFGKDEFIEGEASQSNTLVKLIVDGEITKHTKTNVDGSYKIHADGCIKNRFQKVRIARFNSNNQQVDYVEVKVK